MRHYPSFFLAVAMGLMCSADAGAQTAACPALEARLASLDRTSDDYWNNDLRDTQAAIDRKRADLDQAMSSARRAGCYGGLLFKTRQSGKNCKALAARVDRARSGLQKVEIEQRSVAGDPYAAERERSRVVGELVANQCGRYASFERPGRRSTGLLSSIFGSRRFFPDRSTNDEPFGVGTYRTLCVRTCDGYYFPISFKASPGEFARDEGACRAMCPGTDVALYVHRNPGEQAEQMVSLAGQPYTALPTAFRYRKVYDRACSCPAIATAASAYGPPATTIPTPAPALVIETNGGVLTITAAPPPEPPVDQIAQPPPPARPGGDADPETTANRTGAFAPGTPETATHPAATTAAGPNGKRIRVVGPTSYISVE